MRQLIDPIWFLGEFQLRMPLVVAIKVDVSSDGNTYGINFCVDRKTVQVGAHKKADRIVHLNSEVIVDFSANGIR